MGQVVECSSNLQDAFISPELSRPPNYLQTEAVVSVIDYDPSTPITGDHEPRQKG